MRFEAVKVIFDAALKDKRIYFITGDLAHACSDDFKKLIPNQYINAGIAEQNMIGVAAGLALSGMKVFVYSITPFAIMRCFEQIKVDVCYQNVDVTIIGIGAGYAYSTSGCTHHAVEDIAIIRVLPNMKIYSPASPFETKVIMESLIKKPGPSYLRLGRGGESNLDIEYDLEVGKGAILRDGSDVTIFSTGSIIVEALKASDILASRGISAEVINIHTIKPIDVELVKNRASVRKGIFVLEEHNVYGGLGGAVAEIICENGNLKLFKRFGVPDLYIDTVGSQSYLRGCVGLLGNQVAEEIFSILKKHRS